MKRIFAFAILGVPLLMAGQSYVGQFGDNLLDRNSGRRAQYKRA